MSDPVEQIMQREIDRLTAELALAMKERARAIHVGDDMEQEVERLRGALQFVERWANHHGAKPHTTPQEALSVIQHYPLIVQITKSYADGKVPDTPNPWAERDALREQLTLAESVRAAQVAGLTEGAERLRERVAVLEDALRVAFKWGGGLTVAEGEQIRAALKGEA